MTQPRPTFRRREFLSTVSAALAVGSGLGRADAAAEASASLKELGQRKEILFGAAVSNQRCQEAAALPEILRNCSILTSEGEMKWKALRPGPTQFNFAGADYFMQFSEKNRLAVHGHTLLWYQALPAWFSSVVTSGNAADFMTQHIRTVVQRYRSKIRYWDVVNEVIDGKSTRPDKLRDSPWLRFIGPDYIEQAFHIARTADPDATLVWNEDDLESDTEYSRTKRHAVLNLLRNLRKKNVQVQGLGLQAHLKPAFNKDNRDYQDFLSALKDTGVQLLISELDVIDTTIPALGRDEAVAALYYDFVSTTCRVFKPVSLQVWELSDSRNWMDTSMPSWRRVDGLSHRPAVLDDDYVEKPAFKKLQKALEEIQ
jgi:endo-1,4-beta-xylanase